MKNIGYSRSKSTDYYNVPGLGKKKSKCCCQFRKARTELEDSSSEEEEGCDTCPGH